MLHNNLFFEIITKQLTKRFSLLISIVVGVSSLKICLPIIFKQIVDKFLSNYQYNDINSITIIYLSLFSILLSLELIKGWLCSKLAIKLELATIKRSIDKIGKLSYEVARKYLSEIIINKLCIVGGYFKKTNYNIMFYLLPNIIELCGILIVLVFNVHIKYLTFILILIIIYISFTVILQKKLILNQKKIQESHNSFITKLSDTIKGQEIIRLYDLYDSNATEIIKSLHIKQFYENNLLNISTSMEAIQNFLFATAIIGTFAMAIADVTSLQMTIGQLIMIHTYIFNIFLPIKSIGSLIEGINIDNIETDMLMRLLSEPDNYNSTQNNKIYYKINLIENITFKNVSYSLDDREIITRANFSILPNQINLILGHNGAGKTTIIRLLLKLIVPTSGKIFINNIDLQNISTRNWLSQVAIVPQKYFFFNDTIINNLIFSSNSTELEIINVCKTFGIDEWIVKLPNGYNTLIGDNGIQLSSGQYQILNIARAMLKQSSILVLDESTTNLDKEAEKIIMNNIIKVYKKTVIMITHKPNIAADMASNVIRFNNGLH